MPHDIPLASRTFSFFLMLPYRYHIARVGALLCFVLHALLVSAQVSQSWSPADLPDTLATPQARMQFLAEHYWDKTDFSQPEALIADSSSEQAFVDFVNLVPLFSEPQQYAVFEGLWRKVAAREMLLTHYRTLAEKYLFDPLSPFVNEDVYLVFLRTLIASGQATAWHQAEAKRLALQAIGQPLAPLDIVTTRGDTLALQQVAAEKETILFLFDPECEQCHEQQQLLEQQPTFLRVIALYTGHNAAAYAAAAAKMPSRWTIATPAKPLPLTHLYLSQTRPALYLIDAGRIAWRGYSLPQH